MAFSPQNHARRARAWGLVNFKMHLASVFDSPDGPLFLSPDICVGGAPASVAGLGTGRYVCTRVCSRVYGRGTIRYWLCVCLKDTRVFSKPLLSVH